MALTAALAMPSPALSLEYVPIYNATLLGGQYFFNNSRASLSGNANALAAPVLVQSDQWSFIPLLASNYQGTKGVNDSVAAGTLFAQEMDHRASFTAVDALPGTTWKLKPSVSYKREFLKETLDESWGHGLFDYDKIAVGFEAENIYKEPFSYRVGFDAFKIRYMNYQSLESQATTDPLGNPLSRSGAGSRVLDTYNYQLSGSLSRPYPFDDPKIALSASYSFLMQDYYNDTIVNAQGQYQSNTRRDFLQTLGVSVGYPRKVRLFDVDCALATSFGGSLAVNVSNQNLFDAAQTKFVPDEYSFWQFGFGPGASLSWGEEKHPASVGASFKYLRNEYYGRIAQDGTGLYTGNTEFQDFWQLGLNYAYPLATGFALKAQANFLWARSNNHFESTYSYNYTNGNYLLGFSYEY